MKLKFPDDVHNELIRKYKNNHCTWLTDTDQFPLSIKLGTVNEHQAQQQLETIKTWVSAWQSYQNSNQIVWCDRRWRNLGLQCLPERIVLHTPLEIAAWIGETQRFEKAQQRYQWFTTKWPALTSHLPHFFSVLADYTDEDIQRLISVLTWIEANPQSNLYPRQLPIAGIDSKWLERHKIVIGGLISILREDSNQTLDFFQRCGLKQIPHTLRLRLLDKNMRARFGGLEDITVPLHQLATLNLTVKQVYIVENLQTGLAFGDLPESIVIMQLGYGVEVLTQLPWLQNTDCLYWGDIDTHGFAILNRARSHLPNLRSILMDEDTLHRYQHLWVSEQTQNATCELPLLTSAEQAVYHNLKQQHWGMNVRLEQERVDWEYAWTYIFNLR